MSYQSRNLDYADIAKKGFLAGVALFAIGILGGTLAPALVAVPSFLHQLFIGLEVTGVLVALVIPIVFGAVLPLTE